MLRTMPSMWQLLYESEISLSLCCNFTLNVRDKMVPSESAYCFNDKSEMILGLDVKYYNWFPLGSTDFGVPKCINLFPGT